MTRRLPPASGPSRRRVVAGLVVGAATTASFLQASAARANNPPLEDLLRRVAGGALPRTGRVLLDIPRLSETGNAVPLQVRVESPMTEADHVRWVHVIAELNPFPDVARFHLSPRAGRAQVATSIRLADTQQIAVVAAMSDGSFWMAQQEVIVTLSACISGG